MYHDNEYKRLYMYYDHTYTTTIFVPRQYMYYDNTTMINVLSLQYGDNTYATTIHIQWQYMYHDIACTSTIQYHDNT